MGYSVGVTTPRTHAFPGNPVEDRYQIGEAAERVGLSLRTVRYYEEVGLIVPSGRTPGGFRLYTDDDVDRLLLIKRMKPLGFTLDQMADLLAVRDCLIDGGLDPEERAALLDRLAAYAAEAGRRCEALRKQLEYAEDFARTLLERVDRYRRAAPGARRDGLPETRRGAK